MNQRQVVEQLKQLTRSNWKKRRQAELWLQQHAGPELTDALQIVLASEASGGIREQAIRTLGRLATMDALPTLQAALKDQDPRVRLAAIETLEQLGDLSGIPATSTLLGSSDWQEDALHILIRHPSPEATAILCEALHHETKNIYFAAHLARLIAASASECPVPALVKARTALCRWTVDADRSRPFRKALSTVDRVLGTQLPIPVGPQTPEPQTLPIPAHDTPFEPRCPQKPQTTPVLEFVGSRTPTALRVALGILLLLSPWLLTALYWDAKPKATALYPGALLVLVLLFLPWRHHFRLEGRKLFYRLQLGRFTIWGSRRKYLLHPGSHAYVLDGPGHYEDWCLSRPEKPHIALADYRGKAIRLFEFRGSVERERIVQEINAYLDALEQDPAADLGK